RSEARGSSRSSTDPPAQNAGGVAVRTRAPIEGSAAASSTTSASCSVTSSDSALRRAGSSSVTIATSPSRSSLTRESSGFSAVTSGGSAIRNLSPEQMRAAGLVRTSWWGLPTRNTLDRGTALLPELLAARLPELGIDHAILYPTYGLVPAALDDASIRLPLARAFNTFYS